MQRFTFQLSIGGKHIMSEKSPVLVHDSQSGKKADQGKVPNGELIIEKESNPKIDTKPDLQEKTTDQEKINTENTKNMEEKTDKKPQGITKEQEEKLLKGYKHVPEEYKEKLLDFFKRADIYNLGFLTIQTFARALRGLGFMGTDTSIANIFVDINKSFDGEITIYEFFDEMTKKDPRLRTEAETKAIFQEFDLDKDGFITKEELEKGLDRLKIKRTNIMITTLMKKTDKDKDGKISLADFLKACEYKKGEIFV